MSSAATLSSAQRDFLASYVPDICFGENAWLQQAERAQFVESLRGMDFDGQVERRDVRIAKNLHAKGLFSAFDMHYDIAGNPCIYVEFSSVGADAVFDVMRKGT